MIHYSQGEYICYLNDFSYRIKKGVMSSVRWRKNHKEVLWINNTPLPTLTDFQNVHPNLYDYVVNFFPHLERDYYQKNNTKPIVLWYRFLARHVFCYSSHNPLRLSNNVIDMRQKVLEWYLTKGWVIQTKKESPYLHVKKYNKYPFSPQEINEIRPILKFESVLLQILYSHGAYMDADCAFCLMDDYCNQSLSLAEYEEFIYYLHIGNILCSKEQYERWKDKKDDIQEECCLLI